MNSTVIVEMEILNCFVRLEKSLFICIKIYRISGKGIKLYFEIVKKLFSFFSFFFNRHPRGSNETMINQDGNSRTNSRNACCNRILSGTKTWLSKSCNEYANENCKKLLATRIIPRYTHAHIHMHACISTKLNYSLCGVVQAVLTTPTRAQCIIYNRWLFDDR